jgi:thiol-disulfide isomerase/thioredoxin
MGARITWIALIVILLNACADKHITTTFSGKLASLPDFSIALVEIDNYFPGLTGEERLLWTTTDSVGNFVIESTEINSGFYQIVANNYHRLNYDVFINVGDSIHIEQSSWNEPDSFQITGKGSDKMNYLMRDHKVFPNGKAFYNDITSNKFPSADSFKRYIDSIQHVRLMALNSDKHISELLKSRFAKVIQAECAELLLDHLEQRNYNLNEEFGYYYPDSSYFAFLDTIEFDGLFCQSSSARTFAKRYLEFKTRMALKNENDEGWWELNCSWRFEYVLKQRKGPWRDLLALSTFQEFSFEMMRDTFFDELFVFNQGITSSFFSDESSDIFKININEYLRLSIGNPAPDFGLPDTDGDVVRLSDFVGSVVYIDFWGTWCYPCIKEIPDAIKLQSEFQDEPVIFLYVALEYEEDEIARWKEFVQGNDEQYKELLNDKPFPGVHLVAEKQFLNTEIRPYKINYAPTFVLIDHQGNIVSARADRSVHVRDQLYLLVKEAIQDK